MKMLTLIILFVIGTKAIINPHGPTIVNDYTNCLIHLMDTDFNNSGLLIFANTNHVSTSVINIRNKLLEYIHASGRYSVQVTSPGIEVAVCGEHDRNNFLQTFDKFEAVPLADYFVIIIDSYSEFTYLASKLLRNRSWNPRAKFAILLLNFVSDETSNTEHVENILTCLYRFNVVNIVVIVPEPNKIRNALIYGWRPYDPPKYCGYDNETAKNRLIKENICEKGKVKYNTGVFKDRLPSNMKGCVLYILALERQPFVSSDESEPNMEMMLINEMLATINYEPKYEILNAYRGEREITEWNGAIRELVSRRGNILLGGIFPDNDVHEDFECSTSYLGDSYTWVVPRAYPLPRGLSLILIFARNVWVVVVIVFFICAFVWRILGQLSRDTIRNKTIFHCFLSTWICTLGFCTYLRPKNETLRVFFVFFNLYCIMCLTAYQTKLIDVLRNPSFEHQIETVEELVSSDLKFGGFEELHDLFHNSSDPFDYQLGEKWVDVEDISQAMIDVAIHRNFSLLCSRLELAHISAKMPELSDGFGNYKYYAFEMNEFSVPMEIVSMKGFPFMKEFSKILANIKQLGSNAKVRRLFSAWNMRRRAKLLRTSNMQAADVVALSLRHLQGGFLVLLFGYVIGTLAFIGEIIVNSNYVHKKFSQCQKSFKKE
uniref:Ionotropic receptor 2 n=1 Tax=Conogethes punctiferalis TaxID=1133088 RepID=A0A1Y9TJP2_CONPF|nr:ionotropic receptor 2 [Conogethes punctiferalis]